MRRHVLTITTICVITGLGSAQTEEEREYLLGKGIDLAKVIERLERLEKPLSLTEQTPPWIRVLIRRTFDDKSTEIVIKQFARIFSSFLGRVEGWMVRPVIQRAATMEGQWLSQNSDKVPLRDLVILEKFYALVAMSDIRVVRVSVPWEQLLLMALSRKSRFTEPQYVQLFELVKNAPARAKLLHAHAAAIILRRSKNQEQIADVLASLSHSYSAAGVPSSAAMLWRESMRRRRTIKDESWVALARLCAQALDARRARAALAVAQKQVNDADLEPAARQAAERRIANAEVLTKLVGQTTQLRRRSVQPKFPVEDWLHLLTLSRRLSRGVDARMIAERLVKLRVKDARLFTNLGLMSMHAGMRQRALKCFRGAERLPNRDLAFHELGAWLMMSPLLKEVLLFARGKGDVDRMLARAEMMRTHLGALAKDPANQAFAAANMFFELIHEFTPAIRERSLPSALGILKKNRSRILELRHADFGVAAPQMIAIFAIAVLADPEMIRGVLTDLTAAERKYAVLEEWRVPLAILLLRAESDDATHKLIQSALNRLSADKALRYIVSGVRIAVQARNCGDEMLWDRAVAEFRAGLALEDVEPEDRACLLNNLGMCQYFRGRVDAAHTNLTAAVEALPKNENLARLNSITCTTEIDGEALDALAQRGIEDHWQVVTSHAASWQAWRALANGEKDRAGEAAKKVVDSRFPLLTSRVDVITHVGSFTWGVGIRQTRGFDLNLSVSLIPWLTRPSPITSARIDELIKKK